MDKDASKAECHLLDLPWEDVLVPHVLSHVPLQTLVQLQRVSRQFRALVQLYLANCRDFQLSTLGPSVPREAFCSMLRDNRVLQSLSLHSCSDWVSDSELLPVVGQNQQLQRVDLRGCTCLTRRSLVAVSLTCTHLAHLGLAHCEWVDSLSLRSLADHCGGLRSVDLTACRQLKDEAICYLARKCVKLRSVSLAVNANVTDEAVEAVAKSCRELERLDLTGCLRVNDHSIRTLTEYCPRLLSLKVNHCHNVSEHSLEPLRRRGVEMDVEPPLQRALVLLQDVLGFAPFINLQI
ncbi:F-box/LRR-repeat protein 15 [Eucyclogobius newberryi]|uniref:F-box/LRR-repeat protein 15 n=1 Tax=Eucyclogobius newberryi TaxID=166745 RepID=UPI003B5AD0ED